ncbi:MAG TPA: tetratricopeptide repeat protein [Terracidiphilus sp.]|jgi:TolB-like protein/Tfp pilus assembly protein PilF
MDRDGSAVDAGAIRPQLERILASKVFFPAQRSQAFLRYVVEKSILGSIPKEYEIAVDVFERSANYDPAVDSTVRVEASRLRNRLREYYDTQGKHDPISIDIPKGGYSAVFTQSGHEPVGNREDPVALTAGRIANTCTPPTAERNGLGAALGSQPDPANAAKPVSNEAPKNRRRAIVWMSLLVAFSLAVAFSIWGLLRWNRAHADITSLVVLPMQNLSGDPGQDYFAAGMTDELTTELARIHGLRVVSRTSAVLAGRSQNSIPQIANALKVDAVVEGSVLRSGDKIRITAQLIDAPTDRHLWAQSFEGPASDVLSLQDSVARQIATQASLVLEPPLSRPPVDPAAHDAYLRGRYFFNKQDFPHSLESFQQAIALDPNYASAYAGYADTLDAVAAFELGPPEQIMPKALAAAQRAIQLDPQNGEAYTELGSVQTIYEWDWNAAEQNLTRGIALSPNDSIAEFKYAAYLDAVGRPQDAVTHMRRALQLDPLSFLINRRLGATLYLARQYDAALAQLRRAAEMEDSPGSIDNYMSLIYEQKGEHDEAVQHDLIALHADEPRLDTAPLLRVFQQHGWQSYWRARNQTLLTTSAHPCTAYEIGVDDLRVNDFDQAFESLQRALDSHCVYMALLRVDPLFDSVRHDPRYAALLARMHR